MPESTFFSTKHLAKQMISRDIMELRFERPAGFSFLAGQFVQFKIPTANEGVLRPYSISSAPANDYLEFCLKILPDGKASQYFVHLAVGENTSISEAKGVFICRPEHVASKMCIATGAGVAPIISMIEDRLKNSDDEVGLLFGVRTPDDIFWLKRLEALQDQFKNFSFKLTVSRPDESWTGLGGRVTAHLTNLERTDLERSTEYYICGSVEMVKDVRALLLQKGVNTKSVHFEIF